MPQKVLRLSCEGARNREGEVPNIEKPKSRRCVLFQEICPAEISQLGGVVGILSDGEMPVDELQVEKRAL